MPRSKSVTTYPKALWQICERCAVNKEVFEMEVPTIQKALSLQGQFYAFRGALRKEYESVSAKGKDPAWEEKLKAFIEFSGNTVCWVDRPGATELGRQLLGGVKVKFMHRDSTPTSELLDQMLTTGKSQAQIGDDVDKSLQDLLNKVDSNLIVKSES